MRNTFKHPQTQIFFSSQNFPEEPAAEIQAPDSTDDIITPPNQSGDNKEDPAGSEEAAEEVKKDGSEPNKRCDTDPPDNPKHTPLPANESIQSRITF